MTLEVAFEPLELDSLGQFAETRREEGWRFVQILAVNTEAGIDLVYSFMKDGRLVNSKISSLEKDAVVPSVTDRFLEAFVFENEIHDLFGVDFEGIAIDFEGSFYDTAQPEPMTIVSPQQAAAREAQAPADAAPDADAALEAKLAGMDPEKAAKVRAAMEARAKRAATKAAEADSAKDGE